MKKEELSEMINNTIIANGKKGITGKSLNLALNAIVDSMGSGGGGLMLHYLPRYEIENISSFHDNFLYYDKLQECIDHNIEIYNTIMECNTNHIPVPGPIYFDTTFFEWNFNNRENSVRGGIAAAWRVYHNGSEYVLVILSLANGDMREEIICSDGLFGEPQSNQPV
jgi:hypothetical protein